MSPTRQKTNSNLHRQKRMSYWNGYYDQKGAPPPLPPKPPTEYVRSQTPAVAEFKQSSNNNNNNNNNDTYYEHDDINDILNDYDFNRYNYPPQEPANQRRPSQLRGPRQPSSGFVPQYQQYRPPPPPPPPPPRPQQFNYHQPAPPAPPQHHNPLPYPTFDDPPPAPAPAPVPAPAVNPYQLQHHQVPQVHHQQQQHQRPQIQVQPQYQQHQAQPQSQTSPQPPSHNHSQVPANRYQAPAPMPALIDTSYTLATTHVNAVVEPVKDETSSQSSIHSSVERTTSTNTVYSRISIPEKEEMVVPDSYDESFSELPIERPAVSPQEQYQNTDPYEYVDDFSEDEEEMPAGFMASIRAELNQTSPTSHPPVTSSPGSRIVQSPTKSSFSEGSRSPIKTPTTPSKRISKDYDLERIQSTSSISNESKFYSAYNRSPANRQQHPPIHVEEFDYNTTTSPGPQRMKTVGGASANSKSPQLTSLPRSSSAKETSLHSHAYVGGTETFNSSMRSSSRSTTDDTLMKALDLPSIPASRKSFDNAKLSSKDYETCPETWSLSKIAEWIATYHSEDGDMPFEEVSKALVGLFTHHLPTLNWIKAERIAEHALNSIIQSNFITVEENGMVKIDKSVEVSGVLPTLGSGCYAYHGGHDIDDELQYRCYCPRCARTLPMRAPTNVELQNSESSSDWAAYWNIDPEDVAALDKHTTKRQYAIHELIVGEEGYIRDLNTLIKVYGESLEKCDPPIMKNQDEFYDNAFNSVKVLIECNTKHLLSPFKYRQTNQGPYLEGIADIVLEWARQARQPYVQYADSYLLADRRLRQERESNSAFASWFEKVSKDPRAKGAPHSFYFHRAIPRLARYGLLLKTIQKATPESDPEWKLLNRAITECDEITGECNKRLAMVEKQVEIMDLHNQIRFKSHDESVDLRLRDGRRKVFRRGDVLRRGDYRMDWIPTHLMLFDNFLVLSKIRKGLNGPQYYVTKRPIPLDLLVLESVNEESVTKSTTSKLGVGTLTYHVGGAGGSGANSPDKRMSILAASSPVSPIRTNGSGGDSVTTLGDADREIMYPFKVSHLGRNGKTYTLYASSKIDREKWRDAIIAAKREYSSAVFAANAEPFRMKVIAENAFGYESSLAPRLPVFSPATALDRALHAAKQQRGNKEMPRPLARSKINCAVSFVFADGVEYTMLGLDYGVYVATNQKDAIWRRCIDIPRVTQIDVIEDLNVVVLLAEKALVYYDLDAVLSTKQQQRQQLNGYRLSKHREVGFFSVGHLKDRTLLFYKRREGMSSTFKVIEPVKEKGSQRKRSKMVFARSASMGSTEFFREVEKFYVPTEAYGMNLFKSSFAVHTTRGFEVMSLDVKLPQTVPAAGSINNNVLGPIFKASNTRKIPAAEVVKKRLESTKPVGMFRVSDSSLILCYEEFAMYCDNHGNIIGPTFIEFVCRAKNVALQHPYLLVFDDEMVEVRRIDQPGGKLLQVISGKDIRAIDTREGSLKIALAHPEVINRQLVVELVTNEFVIQDDNSSLAGL